MNLQVFDSSNSNNCASKSEKSCEKLAFQNLLSLHAFLKAKYVAAFISSLCWLLPPEPWKLLMSSQTNLQIPWFFHLEMQTPQLSVSFESETETSTFFMWDNILNGFLLYRFCFYSLFARKALASAPFLLLLILPQGKPREVSSSETCCSVSAVSQRERKKFRSPANKKKPMVTTILLN